MAEQLDQDRANIAMRLAVNRWRKAPNDSIETKLDEPQEWLMEAALMNRYLPRDVQPNYSFLAVDPREFSVGIKLVRQYAGLIYKHMVPVAAAAHAATDAFAKHFEFDGSAKASSEAASRDTFNPFGGE